MNLKTGIYYKQIESTQMRIFKLFTDPTRPEDRQYGQYQAKAFCVLIHNRIDIIEIYYLTKENEYLYLSERDTYGIANIKDLRNIIECVFERETINYRGEI